MSGTYAGSDSFPSSVTIPSDGDAKGAASVNPGFEGLADRAVWLKNRTGAYRLIEQKVGLLTSSQNFNAVSWASGSNPTVTFTGCKTDDIIEVHSSWVGVVNALSTGKLQLRHHAAAGTVTEPAVVVWEMAPSAASTDIDVCPALHTRFRVTADGYVTIVLQGQYTTAVCSIVVKNGRILASLWRDNA